MSIRFEAEVKVKIVKWYYENKKSIVCTQGHARETTTVEQLHVDKQSGTLLRSSRKKA